MNPKPIWQTKTFWINILGGAAQIANSTVLPMVPAPYLIAAQAGLNIAIRLVTDAPASLTGN